MMQMQQFENLKNGLLVRAPAKLNLSLLIAGRRPDGFHEIETIMAKIDWYDEIRIEPAQKTGIELLCQGPHWAPQDQSNLVYRAAQEILQASGQPHNVRLTLTKNIPAGSGLGSASSDAAATLIGLNAYLNLGLSRSQLMEAATRLGSDVAFFLSGPLAFCTGRGEKIQELPKGFDFTAILILPDVSSSTKEVYANYTHDGVLYRRLSTQIGTYIAKKRIDSAAGMCVNMLARSCFHLHEELRRLKEAVESLGVEPVCLSGSGSTLFSIVQVGEAEHLERLRGAIADKTGCGTVVVRNNRW